jgi:hypothetical protein
MTREEAQRLEAFINNNSFIEVRESGEDAFVLVCGVTELTITPECSSLGSNKWLEYELEDRYT